MSTPAFSLWSPSQQSLGKEVTGPKAVNIIRPGAHPVQSPSAFSNSSASSYFTAVTGSYGSSVVTPPAVSPSPGRHMPRVAPAAQLDISGETARLIQSYSSSSSASNVSNRSGHARVAPTILNSTTITSALNNHHFHHNSSQRERERERSNSLLSKGAQRSDDGFHSDSSDRQSEESFSVLSNSNGNHPADGGPSEDERSASPSLLTPTADRNTHPLNYNRASVIGAADDRVKYGPQRSESLSNNEPNKVVAKMRTGTILNGKGELVTMGATPKSQDEARVNRTIADLELQNRSLIAVNAMHEATIRKQATQIAELKKRLSNGDVRTDSPTSDDDEDMELTEEEKDEDKFFKRIILVMDHLIDQAKAAVAYQPTFTGRVLSQYDDELPVINHIVPPIISTDDLDAVIDLDRDEDDDDERLSTTSSSAESGAVTPRQATPIPHSKPATPKTTTTVPKTAQTPKVVTTKPRSTSTTRAKGPSPLSQTHKSGTLS